MRISKVTVDGFGLFDGSFDLSLPDGIALVVGDNETGKSTLLKGISAILYGLASEKEKSALAPHGTASPRSGNLEIESNGDFYRISRDFSSNHTRIEHVGASGRVLFDGSAKPGGRTEEKEAFDRLMSTIVGIENEDLFRNSVLVEQGGLQPEMNDIVRRIATGSSSADYMIALDNLKKSCDDLTMEAPWRPRTARKPRAIEKCQARLQEKRSTLSEARLAAGQIEQINAELSDVESKVGETTQTLDEQKSWSEALEAYARAIGEKTHVERQLSTARGEMHEVERLAREVSALAEQIEREYTDYASLTEQVENELNELTRLRQNQEETEEKLRITQGETPRLRVSRISIAMLVSGLLATVCSVIFLDGSLRIAAILFCLGVCLFVFTVALAVLKSTTAAHRRELNEISGRLERLKEQCAEIENRYPILKRESPADVQRQLHAFRNLSHEKEKKEEALNQHPSLDDIRTKYDSLSNELVVVTSRIQTLESERARLVDMQARGEIGKELEETRTDVQGLKSQLQELVKRREGLREKLIAAEARGVVSQEHLEEEIADDEKTLDRLILSRDAYFIAIGVLEAAILEFQSSHLQRIEKKTSDYLTRITNTACSVSLNKELEPLGVEEEGLFFDLAQLSQGMRDQLHFALRMASVEEIASDKHLPLLLDDPFVNFDEDRLKAALQMLENLAELHQVVLLTHDRRYCEWKDPSCVLPSNRDTPG